MKDLSSFSFIFVGDTHGFLNDFIKQKEIIESVKPDFVLAEQMQDINFLVDEDYSKLDSIAYLDFKKIKSLMELCKKLKINLIGLDFKDFGFDGKLNEVINDGRMPSKEEELKIAEIIRKRENHHLNLIKQYKNSTKRPLVILIGTWHLREDSLLMRELDNCLVIYPGDIEGNMLIEPSVKKEEVNYYVLKK